DAVRVGDCDRSFEDAGFLEPGGPGHLAIAVEGEPGAEHRVRVLLAAGMDDGDAGANRSAADDELAAAGDERGVPDFDAAHIRDRVQWPGGSLDRNAKGAHAAPGRPPL